MQSIPPNSQGKLDQLVVRHLSNHFISTSAFLVRAGTIRRLSPTIVADCFRFSESIPNHKKSILVTTINMSNKPCYSSVMQFNLSAWESPLQYQLLMNQLNPLNCNSTCCELSLTLLYPIICQLQLTFLRIMAS